MMDPPIACPWCHEILELHDSVLGCNCGNSLPTFKYYMSTNGFEIYADLSCENFGDKYMCLFGGADMNWHLVVREVGTKDQMITKGTALDSFESGVKLLKRYKNLLAFA